MVYKNIINVQTDCVSHKTETNRKTGRYKFQWNLWKNMPVAWICHHLHCLIKWAFTVPYQWKQKYALYSTLTGVHQNRQCPRLGYLIDTKIYSVSWLYVYLTAKNKSSSDDVFSNTNKNPQCSRTLCVLDVNSNTKCFTTWCQFSSSSPPSPFPIRYIAWMRVRFPTEPWVFEIRAPFTLN